MLTGKKIILFGAGQKGESALNRFGPDKIYCFADNNKSGEIFCGKPVISLNNLLDIHADYDIVLSVGAALRSELNEQLNNAGIAFIPLHKAVTYESFASNPEIEQFKDTHKGERCFLIGNGPSLKAEDLTALHDRGEICFGCNSISKIFAVTPWRPHFFVAVDSALLLESEMLASTEARYKFLPERFALNEDFKAQPKLPDERILYFKSILCPVEEAFFSPDPSKAVYTNATVMYPMIQMAVYMGFAEIFLLGVDGTISQGKDPDEFFSERRHFYEDDENLVRQWNVSFNRYSEEESTIRLRNAYTKAERYTREHGVTIYNATRGGKLEIFERINFDSLF